MRAFKIYTIVAIIFTALFSCKSKNTAVIADKSLETSINLPDSIKSEIKEITVQDDANLLETDNFRIIETNVIGDILELTVSYGGGCKDHLFSMHTTGNYGKSYPPKLIVFLKHVGNGDMCKALLTEKIYFDLKSVQFRGSDILHLQLNNYDEFIIYTY